MKLKTQIIWTDNFQYSVEWQEQNSIFWYVGSKRRKKKRVQLKRFISSKQFWNPDRNLSWISLMKNQILGLIFYIFGSTFSSWLFHLEFWLCNLGCKHFSHMIVTFFGIWVVLSSWSLEGELGGRLIDFFYFLFS